MIDTSYLCQMVAELAENIEQDYPDSCELGVVAVVFEVNDPEWGDTGWSAIGYRCSDTRRWVQSGLFEAAQRAVLNSGHMADEDEE